MSLLEDVFLRDEANEAQELERVIEGDEFDERPRNRSDSDNNSERSDEAEEDKIKVDPASSKIRRIIKNPRFVLNPARLTGPRGIHIIPEHFKDFKFKGKGHEKEDLDLILKKLEHWAYRLYPKYQFEDCLKKIETLGKKRPVMVNLHKIRSDQFTNEEPIVQSDSTDSEQPQDEFDKLLQQQIDMARAEAKTEDIHSPHSDHGSAELPKPSQSISDEQKERMLRNRKLAEERRKARMLANSSKDIIPGLHENTVVDEESNRNEILEDFDKNIVQNKNFETSNRTVVDEEPNRNEILEDFDENIDKTKKLNRSNVIDSSDDETQVMNESVTVDVHNDLENSHMSEENDKQNMNNDKSIDEINDFNDISKENDLSQVKSKESEVKTKEFQTNDYMDVDFDDEF